MQPGTETYEQLHAAADALMADMAVRFPNGTRCWGGIKLAKQADALRKRAFKILCDHKYGPPRYGTKRFNLFLTNQ